MAHNPHFGDDGVAVLAAAVLPEGAALRHPRYGRGKIVKIFADGRFVPSVQTPGPPRPSSSPASAATSHGASITVRPTSTKRTEVNFRSCPNGSSHDAGNFL